MADAIQTLPNTKNDLIVSLVQRELKASILLSPFVTDLSAYAGKGAKSVSVPRLSSFTVTNRTLGAAGDATALTDAKDTINLNNPAYVAWVEDHADLYQSTIEYRIEASKRAGSAHGRFVAQKIIDALVAGAGYVHHVGSNADIDVAAILAMRAKLLGYNAKMENLVLGISVDQEAVMLAIPEFVRADAYGNSNIPTGMIGRVYGVPVVVSNLFATQTALMWDKEGIGFALQQAPAMSEQLANEYGSQSKRVVVDQLFGVGPLEVNEFGVGAGKSPLIAKLND